MTDQPGTYRTSSGRVITQAELDEWVADAERGYDPAILARLRAPTAARPVRGNSWSGTIAHVGRATTDGRVIDKIDVGELPMPLLATEDDRRGSAVVGRIDSVIIGPDGVVHGQGIVDRPPGRYGIGIDIHSGEMEFRGNMLYQSGLLCSAHLYDPGSGQNSAWPDVAITVYAADPTL